MGDVATVGGKNASLGEMSRELTILGIRVPEGYAVTADAYRHFLEMNELEAPIREAMVGLKRDDLEDLARRSPVIQDLVLGGELPPDLESEILRGYRELSAGYEAEHTDVAVRSSATAEDLPTASFAGQQESFLNVHGEVISLAEEIGANLIVVGSRGQSPLKRPPIGSVSSSIVRHAHCPVMVVREEQH